MELVACSPGMSVASSICLWFFLNVVVEEEEEEEEEEDKEEGRRQSRWVVSFVYASILVLNLRLKMEYQEDEEDAGEETVKLLKGHLNSSTRCGRDQSLKGEYHLSTRATAEKYGQRGYKRAVAIFRFAKYARKRSKS